MTLSVRFARAFCAALCLASLLTGCSLSHFSDVSTASSVLPAVSGTIDGGQQPVSGSTLRLYTANPTALKGASSSRLTLATESDANGNFTITGNYTCPSPDALVYITATGGNPGLAQGTNNSGISMAAALGTCGTLLANGASTTVVINELTTVAFVEAVAPFMIDFADIGADTAASPRALSGAFANAVSIVNSNTGQFQPASSGVEPPYALYNTLADILAACVNTSGSTSVCSSLFSSAGSGASTDTGAAILQIVRQPAKNVSTLFNLVGGSAPFQPTLATAPADFSTSLIVPVPNTTGNVAYNGRFVAIDRFQQVWVANYNNIGLHVFDQNGKLLYSPNAGGATLYMTADSNGNIWTYGASARFTKFSLDANGAPTAVVIPINGGFTNNVAGMSSDSKGFLWLLNTTRAVSAACAAKFDTSDSATPIFASPGICTSSSSQGSAISNDSLGNAYIHVAAPRSLFEIGATGTKPLGTNGDGVAVPTMSTVTAMRFDPSTNHLWLLDGSSLLALNTDGTVAVTAIASSTGIQSPAAEVIDGAGNVFFTNTVSPYGLGEISPTGVLLSPSAGGFQPTGLNNPQGVAVDAYGNIWIANYGNATLEKIPGLAAPKTQQVF